MEHIFIYDVEKKKGFDIDIIGNKIIVDPITEEDLWNQ